MQGQDEKHGSIYIRPSVSKGLDLYQKIGLYFVFKKQNL